MKELPDSLEQLEKELERERGRAKASIRDSASEPQLMGFGVQALREVRKWLEIYGLNEDPTEENVRAVFERLTPIMAGTRDALRDKPSSWLRLGDRRVNLHEVTSYEPVGCGIDLTMRGGARVWFSVPFVEGAGNYDSQVAKKCKEIDALFATL